MRRVWDGSYTVHEQNDNFAIVEISYICPYCGGDTGVYITIYPESFQLLESGGFCGGKLKCCYCGEKTEVMCP